MPIIGLNFDKIGAKKDNKITGKLQIKNNIKISSVDQEKLSLSNSENILKISFEFKVAYEPKIGGIQINGHILYMEEPKKIDEITKFWKKNKGLPKELSAQVINAILSRCNIKSLMLSQDVNLPPNIKLPMAKVN